ncbi:MAG: hypothetical protein HPY76_13525, partial [Anaerolineae bacterium]|nr:hypothetical protein [Anaerolineae bacterium]
EFCSVSDKINRFFHPAVVLLFLSVASYGILIPSLGFYWDDWPLIWFKHAFGSGIFTELFTSDRPFLAGIYLITANLLGSTPLPWQILALLSRWLVSWLLYWSLSQLWQEHKTESLWIAALFTIYPGFLQQPISVVYSNGLLLLAGYILSLGMMIKAIRAPARYWLFTIIGVAGFIFCTFSTEYYVTLEIIRPVIIWMLISNSQRSYREKIRQTIKYWLPYFVTMIIYLIWRVLIFQFPGYQPKVVEEIAGSSLSLQLNIVARVFQDLFTAGIQPWLDIFKRFSEVPFGSSTAIGYYLLSLTVLAFFITFSLLSHRGELQSESNKNNWRLQAISLGLIAMLSAGGPFIIADLPIKLVFPWDRFTLAYMLGSSIFLVGFIDWLIRLRIQRVVILSIIIALATGSHFLNANTYRREWETQKQFFWQLVWRAPGLKEGTSIVTHTLPLNYYSDNSLTAPLIWTYYPKSDDPELPLVFIYTQVRLGTGLPDYKENLPITQHYRTASFSGTTSESLVIFFSPPGCLHVLQPEYFNEAPMIPEELKRAVIISNPQQIITDPATPAQPPSHIFHGEPEHDWCYYYEKADLARQTEQWEQIVSLGDDAFANDHNPKDASELIPFIEGYANMGDFNRTTELSRSAIENNPALLLGICEAIDRAYMNDTAGNSPLFELQSDLTCPTIENH